MIGFEVSINNNISFTLTGQSVQLFFAVDQQKVILLASGISNTENKLKWSDQILNEGDMISIKVKELKEISTPFKVCKIDLENIIERYLKLKKELEMKGFL